LTLSNPLQASLLTCAAKGISVYCPHTACDAVWGGVNDWLAEGIIAGKEQNEVDILGQRKIDSAGVEEGGEGRVVRFSRPIEMKELVTRIKRHLKLSQSEPGIFFSPSRSTQRHL
jgi:putative NIF3 family GTP cyclohydrolase 1 type 2